MIRAFLIWLALVILFCAVVGFSVHGCESISEGDKKVYPALELERLAKLTSEDRDSSDFCALTSSVLLPTLGKGQELARLVRRGARKPTPVVVPTVRKRRGRRSR